MKYEVKEKKDMKCEECKFFIDTQRLPPHGSFLAMFRCLLDMRYGILCTDGNKFKQNEELSIMKRGW